MHKKNLLVMQIYKRNYSLFGRELSLKWLNGGYQVVKCQGFENETLRGGV